ncbi:MAG: nucleoside recognition domain-containing protein [Pseudomonadota bacterium]|nr:nucleoside recognition domain-containing protein [Pseudomonadota bacterium]
MLSAGAISSHIILAVVVAIPSVAWLRKIALFDSFLEGASNALEVTVKLIPYLVGMIVAVGMLRDSGAIGALSSILAPVFENVGIPKELLPLGLMRPFSGAASNAIMFDLINEFGADNIIGLTAATIMGSTETTFYLAAIYFGAIGVKQTRHAVPASLVGELCGFIASVFVCKYFFN